MEAGCWMTEILMAGCRTKYEKQKMKTLKRGELKF